LPLRAALGAVALAALAGSALQAQPRNDVVAEADSAYRAGDLVLADSLYYIAVRYLPRDPRARTALGRYLAARGKAKPASILLEEARMFGGDPVHIGRELAPLYAWLGEWRAVLTLPGSPLSSAERRRAAWLSEHPFTVGDAGAATLVGGVRGDTIARVAARVGRKTVLAALVGNDPGIVVGTQLADSLARRFEGDPTVVLFDAMSIARIPLANVPATVGAVASTLVIGPPALGKVIIHIDYGRNRFVVTRTHAAAPAARYPLVRRDGQLRVLDGHRWVPLAELAASVARAKKTLVIDVAAGEARILAR
jgi:hypothetical protein